MAAHKIKDIKGLDAATQPQGWIQQADEMYPKAQASQGGGASS